MFGFGAIVANLFTDAGKLLIGRLRPYFLAVCKPDFSKVNCSAGKFITEDICTGDKKQITEARLVRLTILYSFKNIFCRIKVIT